MDKNDDVQIYDSDGVMDQDQIPELCFELLNQQQKIK